MKRRGAADAVVVGGGVIGCAVAWRAAREGVRVTVVERGHPGREASWAAAGMLAPQAEADAPGPLLDLLLRAREMYPLYVAELREETGIDVGYADAGTLHLALREGDEAALEARWAWQSAAGLAIERLTAAEAREGEPAVSPAVRMALRFPGDHQVDNRLLTTALWTAAAQAGVEFRAGVEVVGLTREAGTVTGVALAGGERLAPGAVVVAAGAWAGGLHGLPRPLPVTPVHGQLLAVETVPPLFRHVVDSPRCYLVPRGGRTLAGATTEHVGFRKTVTPAGVRRLLDGAIEIAPALEQLPLL